MRERIGFKEAFSIGVGGMIGGGIFAVLGLSIQLSKSAAPIAFFLAGIIALATAYSYAKLTVRYPSEGGTIEFLVKAFGNGLLAGSLNILLLASYIVMISLYAYAFGSYGASLLHYSPFVKHALITFSIALFTIINAMGAAISGKAEDALVGFKLTILIIVAGAGMLFVNPSKLSPSHWTDTIGIVAGGMIIFLAYEGFELISNTGSEVENPKILPKAFYSAVLLVIVVYISIAIVTVGNLPYDEIMNSRDYALAAAAEPSLGKAGFWLVAVAALASTSSAINATIFGTCRVSYMVAKYGELPSSIEKQVWRQAYEGLFIISLISLIFANVASLESISTAGSGGFLLIFLFVNLAAIRLRDKLKINPLIPAFATILTFSALAVLVYRMAISDASSLLVFIALVVASFLFEFAYKGLTGREISEYLDRKLGEREKNIREWERWVYKAVERLKEDFKDAEVYLVGSVARDEIERANDVDILVLTSNPPRREEKLAVTEKIKDKINLTPQHCIDVHFEHRKRKEEALKRAKEYKLLRELNYSNKLDLP